MKNKSLQWQVTLLVSILIAVICIIMNLLIYYTNTFYINDIDNYVSNNNQEVEVSLGEDFQGKSYNLDISNLIGQYEHKSSISGWIITFTLTIIGGVLTYIISGIFLRPLHQFTHEIEKVEVKNLAVPLQSNNNSSLEIQRLTHTFNNMSNRLSKAFQSQNRFIANAAHEFRTPLAVMQTKLEVFQKIKEPSVEEQHELMTTLTHQINHLSSLVKTLLDMSETHTIEMNDCVNLAEVIDEVLCDLDSFASEKQVTLFQETVPLVINGNDTLISRLVYNLVENAIKYNHQNGTVHVILTKQNHQAILRIQDSGSGIPAEMWKEVMKPFYRVDKSRSREMGGVGLGLAFVNEIVALHHGTIEVEASSSSGTTMKVTFCLD